MKIDKISEEIVADLFIKGIDCSQIVLGYAAGKVGISDKEALKISSAFGGGMWGGRTCGCVTGALMALGLKYGHSEPNSTEQKSTILAKKATFEQTFTQENPSLICKDILGYDLSKPEEMQQILEKNLLFTICPKVVCSTCRMLDEIILP